MKKALTITEVPSVSGNVVLALSGELDTYTSPELRDRIITICGEEQVRLVVFDLREIEFVDSAGLGVIVGGRKRLHDVGKILRLAHADKRLTEVFNITGLCRVFTLYNSVDEALQEPLPVVEEKVTIC